MPKESKANMTRRMAKIIRALKREYPGATTALNHSNPLELLVATILSAQCTDRRVNIITKDLFRKYRTAADYAEAPQADLEADIRAAGTFRRKAASIRGACAKLVEEHGGKVPDSMDDLLALPGVARKTANVVLGTAFGRNEGIVVDTHVIRLAQRLGFTKRKNNQGDKIEKALMEITPRKDWTVLSHMLILHGRAVCTARKPKCGECVIAGFCPSAGKV